MLTAIYYGANDAARLLIKCGGELTLHEAAAVGDLEPVEAALDGDPDGVNSYSHDGWTPLHLAAFFGHTPVATLLLDRGADLAAISRNRIENQPLHAAVANGQASVAALLLDRGADPDAVSRGWTPLRLATENDNQDLVELLLARGANPENASGSGAQ